VRSCWFGVYAPRIYRSRREGLKKYGYGLTLKLTQAFVPAYFGECFLFPWPPYATCILPCCAAERRIAMICVLLNFCAMHLAF